MSPLRSRQPLESAETLEQTHELAERCEDFTADRGLDSAETKALLWDGHGIRPLIDTRELWREEKSQPDYDLSKPITRPLLPERADTIVHTEKGSVHCICPHSGEQCDLPQCQRKQPHLCEEDRPHGVRGS